MFAPEVINYKRWLNCDNGWNGTMVETERGKELLDELYRILSPMKAMGPDDNKRFWIRVARGCADDSWSYDEMLEDGDVKDREDFESMFLSCYPDDEYWFPVQIMDYCGYRAVILQYRCILEYEVRGDEYKQGRRAWGDEVEVMLGFLIDKAKECMTLLLEGRYNDYLEKNLPLKYRYGYIETKYFYKAYPDAKENMLDGLRDDEISEFKAVISRGDWKKESIGRLSGMTASLYFDVVTECYEAIGGRFKRLSSSKETYMRFADGRDNNLAEIDENSEEAYAEWHEETHEGHAWEIIPGHTDTMLHLYTLKDDGGWYFAVSGTLRIMETVRTFLTVRRLGYPVTIYAPDRILKACLAEDKFEIVPEGVLPFGTSTLPNGEFVMHSINLDEEYMSNKIIMDNIKWYELEKVFLKEK